MKMLKKKVISLVIAILILVSFSGGASAHNCPNKKVVMDWTGEMVCELILVITFEDGTWQCEYDCFYLMY